MPGGQGDAILVEAAALLLGSLQLGPILTNVAGLLAPRLADWCYVHLAPEGGAIHRVALACGDAVQQEVAALLEPLFPLRSDRTAPERYALVLADGRPLLLPDLSADLEETEDPALRARLRVHGPRSALLLPLRARGRVLGVVTLLRAAARPPFGEDDLGAGLRLAGLVALAVDNARLHEEALAARRRAEAAEDEPPPTPAPPRPPEDHGAPRPRTAEDARVLEGERRAREAAEAALRQIRESLALLGHELGAPLQALQQAASPPPPPRGRGPARPPTGPTAPAAVERAARRLDRLQRDLLELARSDGGELPLRREACDAAALIEEAVRAHTAAAAGRSLHLRATVPRSPLPVRCDRERARQILDILLQNAVQHTPAQGIIVVRAEPQGAFLRCAVEDTGPGVAPERLAELLAPRPLGPRIHLRRGLGLAIAAALCRAHGGALSAESQPGKGSRFSFTLPLV